MPNLADHQSKDFTKLLLIGDSKCLDGDTTVSVSRGNGKGKIKTLRQLYNRKDHYRYDSNLDTLLTCDLGGYCGLNKMEQIIFSGIKEVWAVSTGFRYIKATLDHKFLTRTGWKRLSELTITEEVAVWDRENLKKKHYPRRAVIYSVPYHPNANVHIVGDYGNYGRITQSRAVLEAHNNGLELLEFIEIIRGKPIKAATLKYISRDWDIHHKDGNRLNDTIENLVALPEQEHVKEHEFIRQKTSKAISYEPITSIDKIGKTDTYDIVMADPHNNFIANGFVVHNSGKTGSLVSLVKAGYKLRILDFDNLLDVLKSYIMKECPDKIANVEFRTLRDKLKSTPLGPTIDGQPKAFVEAMKMLDRWKYKDGETEIDLGVPANWGPECILVIDSLSRLCDAAYDFRVPLTPKGASGKYDERAVYGDAQEAIESAIANLTSDNFETNVIVIAHIRYLDMPDGTQKGFPQSVGKALSPQIPQYFPSVVLYSNRNGKRTLQTNSTPLIDLANPKPFSMAKEYPIETGLADFFKVLRS